MKRLLFCLLGAVLVLASSCKKDERASSEKQLLEFSIGTLGANAKGIVDEAKKTVTLQAIAGVDVAKLVAIIKVSDKAKITPANGVAQDFTKPVTYTVTAEDGSTQAYVVTVLPPKSTEKAIASFKFSGLTPDVAGVIDQDKKTVKLMVPFGTNVAELVPTITLSKNATVLPATAVKQDFSKAVTYTVTAEDGSKQDYTVTVEVGKSSEKKITEFKFAALNPAVVGTIDQDKKTVSVVVPYGTNVKSLVPTIAISANATVDPATNVAADFTSPVTYTVTAQDGTKEAYKVAVEVAKNTEAKITSFKFAAPAAGGEINNDKKTIAVVVPYGTDVTKLIPSITISEKATISPAGSVATDFTNSVAYKVTSESGVVATYSVSVVVAKFATAISEVSSTSIDAGGELTIAGSFVPGKTQVTLDGSTSISLTITSESETLLKVKLPSSVAAGSYTLSVSSDGSKVSYIKKIAVVNPNAPVITSLNKTSFVRGVDELVIYGKNLDNHTDITYIQIGNAMRNVSVNSDGTEARIVIPENIPVGKTTVSLQVGDSYTNEMEITILENTNPAPAVVSVSATSLYFGDQLTITGTGFAASGNKVYLSSGMVSGFTPKIISESATQIVVAIPETQTRDTYTLEVTSNGQTGKFATPISISYGTTVLTGLESATVKTGADIVVKGKYIYNNDTNQRMKAYINGDRVDLAITDLTHIKVTPSSALANGQYDLQITDYKGTELYKAKFTVAN